MPEILPFCSLNVGVTIFQLSGNSDKGYQKGPDVKREREQSVHARNAMLQRVAWDSKKNADNRSY